MKYGFTVCSVKKGCDRVTMTNNHSFYENKKMAEFWLRETIANLKRNESKVIWSLITITKD